MLGRESGEDLCQRWSQRRRGSESLKEAAVMGDEYDGVGEREGREKEARKERMPYEG
jgi:hypothetical protein